MNNLHLSEEAQNDLIEIKAYIEEGPPPPSCKHERVGGSFDTGILYLTSFVGAAMIKKSL